MSSSVLRIGDVISLSIAKPFHGWLSSEGILSDDCVLASEGVKVENCLWEVTVQHQYNSSKTALEKNSLDDDEDNKMNEKKQKNDFKSVSANEDRLNEKLMKMKYGKPVAFGDVIQLRHYLSKKYITVSATSLAKVERGNMRVGLHSRGDVLSWLEFMPRYKYDKEGQLISNDTEAYIRIHDNSSEYIHAARKASRFAINNAKEINCSLESSCWKINIYHSAGETESRSILMGYLVSLHEPELSTHLTIESRKTLNHVQKANVAMSNSLQLSFAASDCNVGTNLLWMIEGEEMFHGGAVTNHVSRIALRDLNSGLYMKMTADGVIAVKNREDCSFFEMSTSQPTELGAPISDDALIKLSCQNQFITMKKGNEAKAQCMGSEDQSVALSMVVSSKLQRKLGVDLFAGIEATSLLRRFELLIRSKKVFSLPKSNIEAEIRRFFNCIDMMSVFIRPEISTSNDSPSQTLASLKLPNTVTTAIRQSMLREQGFLVVLLDIVEHCALGTLNEFSRRDVRSISFLQRGFTEPVISDDTEHKESVNEPRQSRDSLFKKNVNISSRQSLNSPNAANFDKKERIRASLMAAATKMKMSNDGLKSGGDNFVTLVKAAKYKNKFESSKLPKRHTTSQNSSSSLLEPKVLKNSEGSQSTLPSEIAKVCLEVLYISIRQNHANQMSIADFFSVLLNQVKHHREAIACVQEILKDNLQMLQTKIRDREMKIFLSQLFERDMNVTLLNMLRSTCTCPGGVDNTQRMVASALFHPEILFTKKSTVEKTVGVWRSNTFMQKLKPGTIYEKSDDGDMVAKCLSSPSSKLSSARAKFQQAARNVSKLQNSTDAKPEEKKERSVLISVSEKRNAVRRVAWFENRVYFPSNSNDFDQHVLGNNILKFGIPDLVLNWTTRESGSEDYTSQTLFGYKSDVPFTSFFSIKLIQDDEDDDEVDIPVMKRDRSVSPISSPTASSKRLKRMNTSNKKSLASRRCQVVQYFISQMYLVADLCLDRNYVSIALMEKLYSYGMLLAVLKTPNCPPSLLAPVIRIIRCLYVDREPQVEAKFPRLVKTSVTLKGGSEGSFEDYHVGSPFKFAILQHILSEYLHNKLDITRCDELSSEAIDLIQCLMKYGYYNSAEQLQDIIHPFVDALVMHQVGKDLNKPIEATPYGDLDENVENDDDDISDEGFGMENRSVVTKSFYEKFTEALKNIFTKRSSAKVLPSTDSTVSDPEEFSWTKMPSRILEFLESLKVLFFVLSLVLVTTTFSILGLFSDDNKLFYSGFDLFVSVFFATELITRMSCYRFVYGDFSTFYSSSLNTLDVIIVVMDIILLSMDAQFFGYAAKFAKSLKAIRIVRLLRVFRAARLLKTIADKSTVHSEWKLPERYSKTTENEVRTIAGILRILKMAHDRIEDKKLSAIFSAYTEWKNTQLQTPEDAIAMTSAAIEKHESCSAFIPPKFDEALTDIVMYSNPVLVKEALNLLRIIKSEDQILSSHLERIQIISSAASERKYQKIIAILCKMKKYAETFEIWGSLQTKEHLSIANELLQMFSDLKDMVQDLSATGVFDIGGSATEDVEIQNLLSNLDAMSVMMSVQFSLLDESIENMDPVIKNVLISCNELICLFVRKNSQNQITAFKHFDWFLSKVDRIPNSGKVARAIIAGNRSLIKQCPQKHLSEFIQKISVNGQRAEYLDLFVGLTDVDDTGDGSISGLRNEIARYITNTERSSEILLWCCSPDSKEYDERVNAMKAFADISNPPRNDELSENLQYHINLLQLLVGCKLGPKMQAVYSLDDIVYAIMDDRTISHVRNKLVLLLHEIIASNMEGIEASEFLWQFFEYISVFFQDAAKDFTVRLKQSKKMSMLSRMHYTEWIGNCTIACDLFFSGFDLAMFHDACDVEETSIVLTHRTESEILEVISELHKHINSFVVRHKSIMTQQSVDSFEHVTTVLSQLLQLDAELISDGQADQHERFIRNRRSQVNYQASLVEDVQQILNRRKFHDFVMYISLSDELQREKSIQAFLKLPEVAAAVSSDVRFEPFLLKIANYIRSQISRAFNAAVLDKSICPSAEWVVQTMRYILEDQIGSTVSIISDPMTPEEASLTSFHRTTMNSCGVTFLCMDLIAVGIDIPLTVEAIKLLILMLSPGKGKRDVQESMYQYLNETDSTLFFEQIKELIERQVAWCMQQNCDKQKLRSTIDGKDAKNEESLTGPTLHEEIYSLKLISAMCDGHFLLKEILREQEGNNRFVNIVDQIAHFAEILSRVENHASTLYAIRVLHTIHVLIRGPCVGNQEHFILHTDLLTALNRLIRGSRPTINFSREWEGDLESLKEFSIDVLRVSIEGQMKSSVIVERIKTTLDISLLNVFILPIETDEDGNSLEITNLSRVQAKYLVFLQALSDDDDDAEMPFNATERINKDINFVEVKWMEQPTIHYFYVPEIAADLSESSKSVIVAEMNCMSQDLKLKDFLKKATALYREARHQMYLKSLGISNVWHAVRSLSLFMYCNVLLMNIILVFNYVEDSTGSMYLPPSTRNVLLGLNILHCVLSFIKFTVSLLVRVPVIYGTHIANGASEMLAVLRTSTDLLELWYLLYLGISIIAVMKSYLFLSLLLLDYIVLDSTSRDVLYAVVIPARQLFSTFIIMVIVLYITAVVIFIFFRDEFLSFEDENDSMWTSVVLAFNYGIRATEGLGQYMFETTGIRLVVDTTVYFLLVVILRNIFFGIIINTFGELRNIKKEREEHIANRCFICGIDRHDYDKMKQRDQTDFKAHREVIHNIWSYLYFVVKIWYQPRHQDTSLERYVRDCMENDDTTWFPVGLREVEEREVDEHDNKQNSQPNINIQSALKKEKNIDSTDQINMISKIHEKLTSMERQSQVESNRSSRMLSTPAVYGSQFRDETVVSTFQQPTDPTNGIKDCVRREVTKLGSSLQMLNSSIHSCSEQLDDLETASKRRPRLAGIKMPATTENQSTESPNKTAGPSLAFVLPKK